MTDHADILNLDEPYPDLVIDRLRRAAKEQIDDVAAQVQRLNDALLLLQATADFAQSTLNTVMGARAQLAALTTQLDGLAAAAGPMQQSIAQLTGRVQALETAIAPPAPTEESP